MALKSARWASLRLPPGRRRLPLPFTTDDDCSHPCFPPQVKRGDRAAAQHLAASRWGLVEGRETEQHEGRTEHPRGECPP